MYCDLRFDLFAQSKNIEVNFEDFVQNDKLYFLMGNSNIQDILAKTLIYCIYEGNMQKHNFA